MSATANGRLTSLSTNVAPSGRTQGSPKSIPITLPKNLSEHCHMFLRNFIENEKKDLSVFYPDANLKDAAEKAAFMVETLVKRGCSVEYAMRFTTLTLYDLVILLDDSDTMILAEEGERKMTLQKVLMEVSDIYSLARTAGIVSIRFFNTKKGRKNVTPNKVEDVINKVSYTGLTKIGTELKQKILEPLLYKEAQAGKLTKPLLIMIITDGNVEGEADGVLKTQINNCIAKLQDTTNWKMGKHAAAFYFARIGNDEGAKELIEGLDHDPSLGKWIDCFPVSERLEDFEIEDDQPKKWEVLQKLLLGALWADIDQRDKDEELEKDEDVTAEDEADEDYSDEE